MNDNEFIANIKMDEATAGVFAKGLGKLTVEEAGDLNFLFKQTFMAQKQEWLKAQEEKKAEKQDK